MKIKNENVFLDALLIIVAVVGLFLIFHKYNDMQITQQNTEICVSSGYTCYLDGEIIDGSKIDLSEYISKINDSTKEIYLARRHK